MMLGSFRVVKFNFGKKIRGSAPCSTDLTFNSESISICSGWPELAHRVLITNDIGVFRNFPCTKGVAIASIAQAAFTCSPVLKVT